ncbi:hypothetical protein [Variovorax boronicumulans]|uniref:hypothetical protein n=1 Tax=Variovorax boronicumulans TaxID=436515 RepID=UPI0012E600D8|nr:hypothetical protein [Variovorax boronicumulans]GER16679.1 hypothetical protein VCH24_16850 [Variovorax boronicumulans]
MKLSMAQRNAQLAAIKAGLDGGEIRIFSGPIPDNAEDAVGGATLLVIIKNGGAGLTFAAPADGVMLKAAGENWTGTNVATGTASFYRFVVSADDNSASASALRLQGTVGLAGADMNLTYVALVSGAAAPPITYYNVGSPEGM